jgi:urea transport system substrate-binding protein
VDCGPDIRRQPRGGGQPASRHRRRRCGRGTGAIAVGIFAERRLARIISSFDRIARGDRYTSLPRLMGDGAIQGFAGTAETVRAALIEADTLTVDQLRRETEARLHHAGRLFFTGNFRHAVEEVVNAFTNAGERIRGTAAELVQSNKHMAHQVTEVSNAAAQAAEDVAGVAAAMTNDPMEASWLGF